MGQVAVGILAEDNPGVEDRCNPLDMIAGVAGYNADVEDYIIFPEHSGLTCG